MPVPPPISIRSNNDIYRCVILNPRLWRAKNLNFNFANTVATTTVVPVVIPSAPRDLLFFPAEAIDP